MGLSARVTRVVGQIGDCWLHTGGGSGSREWAVSSSVTVISRTLPFVRHRQVGASLPGLIAGGDSQSRVGLAGAFGRRQCSAECARSRGSGRLGLRCNAEGERLGDGLRKSTRKSRLGLCVVTCGPS